MYNNHTSDQYYIEPESFWADDKAFNSQHMVINDLPPYTNYPPIVPLQCPKQRMRTRRVDERENYHYYYREPKKTEMSLTAEPYLRSNEMIMILLLFFIIITLICTVSIKILVDLILAYKKM